MFCENVNIDSCNANKKSNKLAFFVIHDTILSFTLKGKSLSIWKSIYKLFYFNILVIFLSQDQAGVEKQSLFKN